MLAVSEIEVITAGVYKPSGSGFLGLAPYTQHAGASALLMNRNTLFQLNYLDIITNMVFAVYVDNTYGGYSTIKLGGWDQIGLKNGTDLKMMKTASKLGWDVSATEFKIGGSSISIAQKLILMEPGEPYIYVNPNDYNLITNFLKGLYTDIVCSNNYC